MTGQLGLPLLWFFLTPVFSVISRTSAWELEEWEKSSRPCPSVQTRGGGTAAQEQSPEGSLESSGKTGARLVSQPEHCLGQRALRGECVWPTPKGLQTEHKGLPELWERAWSITPAYAAVSRAVHLYLF